MASAAAVFAGKAMATSIISNIVNKAFDYLMDNHKAGGLKSARERLLPQIEVVFDAVDTEEIRDQSRALDAWLWQLEMPSRRLKTRSMSLTTTGLRRSHVPAPTLQRLHYLVFPVLNLWLMEHESDPETLISCYHWYPKGK
ncbi:hypothetical protein ZWY2020_018864 [Hordeum vulgare]|nr:hypothetical protein ZWY2020_018864 [Hordeum vulgare]